MDSGKGKVSWRYAAFRENSFLHVSFEVIWLSSIFLVQKWWHIWRVSNVILYLPFNGQFIIPILWSLLSIIFPNLVISVTPSSTVLGPWHLQMVTFIKVISVYPIELSTYYQSSTHFSSHIIRGISWGQATWWRIDEGKLYHNGFSIQPKDYRISNFSL